MKVPTALLDLRVLLVNEVLPAQLDPPDFQDALDPRAPQAPPERRVDRVRKVHKVLQEEMVSRVLSVFQAQPALSDPQERTEIRERSVNQGKREAKGTRENMVHLVQLVLKAQLDSLVLLVLMGSLDLEDSRGSLGRKVMKDPEGSLDLLAQLGCRVCLGLQVRKEKLETLAKWAPLVPPAQEVPLVPLEQMALKAPQVASATLELWERRVKLVKPESLVFKEMSAHQVPEVNGERRVKPVPLVLLALLVQKVLLEMMVLRAALVQAVSLVTLVLLESLDSLVKMVLLVTREMMERLVNLVLLDLLVSPDLLAHLEREDPLGLLDLKEDKEKKEPRVSQVWRAHKARRVLWVHKVLQASQVLKASGESLVQLVNKASLGHLALMDLLDLWVHRVYLV